MSTKKRASQGSAPDAVRDAAGGGRPREFVQGLERGLAVIRSFSAQTPSLTIALVAERTGLTRAAARRYLKTLAALGYVVQDGDRFSLTPRLLDLGFTYLSTLDVTSVVHPFMETVTTTLHESCSVSVLDNHDIVYIASATSSRTAIDSASRLACSISVSPTSRPSMSRAWSTRTWRP